MLGVRLDHILIDEKKIHANIPRYERKRSEAFQGGKDDKGKGKALNLGVVSDCVNSRSGKVKEGLNGASYAQAVKMGPREKFLGRQINMCFLPQEDDKCRMAKPFVGTVMILGMTYNIHTHFEIEGIFSIKVTPLGANLCLLENLEEGFNEELIREGTSWWKHWFKSIRPWSSEDVDSERVMRIRCYGVRCHVWCSEFFVKIANLLGTFVCLDENTTNKSCMDIARFMVRVKDSFILPEVLKAVIEVKDFVMVLREDSFGPLRISKTK